MSEYNYEGMEVTLPNNKNSGRCRNAITKELDRMSGMVVGDVYHHYILNDSWSVKEKILSIRVPGGTIGDIKYDDNGTITSISIDTNYVVKTYWRHVKKHIQKFVGMKLIFKDQE